VPLPGPPLGASGVGSKVGTLGGTGKEGRKNGKSDDEGACARPSLHRVAWESASPRRENRARGKGHLRIRKHQTSHAIVQFTVSPGMVMFSQLHTQSARRKGGRCTRYGSAGGGERGNGGGRQRGAVGCRRVAELYKGHRRRRVNGGAGGCASTSGARDCRDSTVLPPPGALW